MLGISLGFADKSGDPYRREVMRGYLADALFQAGDLTDVKKLFLEAEAMQKERLPHYPYLYSLHGFRFCDFLLSEGCYQEVQKRATKILTEWAKPDKRLVDISLYELSTGVALMLQAQHEGSGDFNLITDYLQQAVVGLREAGQQHYLPLGLFARAAFYRSQNEFAAAWADLDEAHEIAERGSMGLNLADYHLEASRLLLEEQKENSKQKEENGKAKEAKAHLDIAAEMIEKMGYGRRRPEVEELRKQLQSI